MSKKVLKLVLVLFNLKNGMQPNDVRDQLSLERLTNRTDELCNETIASKSDRIYSIDEETSLVHD